MAIEQEQEVGAISLSSMLEKRIEPENTGIDSDQTQESLKIALGGDIDPPDVEEKEEKLREENDSPTLETKEEKEEVVISTSDYSKILKDILGESFENISIEGEEDENPIPLSEVDQMDSDTFREVLMNHISTVKEESEKNRVSLENISEFTKTLIEIEKNGGDIFSLLEERRDFGDPLERVDLKTDTGLKEAIKLRLIASGTSSDQIDRLIRSYETDGVLEEYGNAAYDELKKVLDLRAENELQRSKIESEKRDKMEKSFKREVKDNLSAFELKDSFKNKIADIATQRNENGQFLMDQAYKAQRVYPARAAEIAFFLTDREEFIKQITNNALNSSKLESAQKRVIIRKTPVSSGSDTGKDKGGNKIVSLTDLENR